MKILIVHDDGTKTVQYEPGDRVVFTRNVNGGDFLGAKIGQKATVIRGAQPGDQWPSIAFLDVQTDEDKAADYGTIHVAPWDVELLS
jgi:hypothetical protein